MFIDDTNQEIDEISLGKSKKFSLQEDALEREWHCITEHGVN